MEGGRSGGSVEGGGEESVALSGVGDGDERG